MSLGSGDCVCLYLPGTNFNTSTSTAVLDTLATRFHVYAADLPGQPGLSATTRPKDEVPAYAHWLAEVVRWVRVRHPGARVMVAGHSRGAAVALSAEPDQVDGLALLSPAGLLSVRPSLQMLRATVPWLVRRDVAGARRLLQYMSGPGHSLPFALVEWMALVARTCRTTGAPGPYPETITSKWRGRNVRVAIGEHDVFFPPDPLRQACLSKLDVEPQVVPGAGHLLADEAPEHITNLVSALM